LPAADNSARVDQFGRSELPQVRRFVQLAGAREDAVAAPREDRYREGTNAAARSRHENVALADARLLDRHAASIAVYPAVPIAIVSRVDSGAGTRTSQSPR